MGAVEFIGGSTGGIPESIFHSKKQRYMDNILGASGKETLMCTICPWEVKFVATSDPNRRIRFKAEVTGRGDTLSIQVQNKDYQGDPYQKHPDIYPEKLLLRTVRYFEKHGVRLKYFAAYWVDEDFSDNYDSYIKFFSDLGHSPSEEDKKQAAFSTWTGQQANKLGFTEITKIVEASDTEDEPAHIAVVFRRPEQENKARCWTFNIFRKIRAPHLS